MWIKRVSMPTDFSWLLLLGSQTPLTPQYCCEFSDPRELCNSRLLWCKLGVGSGRMSFILPCLSTGGNGIFFTAEEPTYRILKLSSRSQSSIWKSEVCGNLCTGLTWLNITSILLWWSSCCYIGNLVRTSTPTGCTLGHVWAPALALSADLFPASFTSSSIWSCHHGDSSHIKQPQRCSPSALCGTMAPGC